MEGAITKQRNDSDPAGQWSDDRRCDLIRRSVVVGLLAVFAIAPRLWLAHDFFGPISLFGPEHRLGFPLDAIAFGLLIILLLPLLKSTHPERWIRIWSVVVLARCAWDRITWQPFLFQYYCMLLVLGWYGFQFRIQPKQDNDEARSKTSRCEGQLNALRLIVFGVYFWSGFSKFNFRFFDRAAQTFFGPLLPIATIEVIDQVIWLIPLAELLLALGLLTQWFRRTSAIGLIGMHLFILWMIGPLGSGVNRVVWPWNLVMIVVLPTLFWNVPNSYPWQIVRWQSPTVHKLVLILCIIMPGLSYVGAWPIYLSFRMYSSREPRAEIQFPRKVAEELPHHVQEWITWHPAGRPVGRLSILVWADQELGVFVPTEVAAYKHVAKRLWNKHGSLGDIYLNVEGEPDFRTGESRVEQFHCSEL